ncbi:hypothetical protein J1P26_22755 [Neobacillus sp. MM2021_6]|uniref:hypothetical protein n=1 Tax=Bacillaceae TaxID=186817 RepID=UPI00140C9AAB|nr:MULTISPECIES: hypothetical protein [Bacillaceae]MBO0962519.1 hypothetical protein [Neobacillus sp. MM2021_6]NHC21003.1 hypothetical protein [Bacillus sp. MM2020_4]
MDKEQLAWQRKVIREEYVNEAKSLSHHAPLSAAQTRSNRSPKRTKRVEKTVGR